MRYCLWLALAPLLLACASSAPVQLGEDGLYRFSDQPFTLRAPVDCVANLSIHEDDNGVRFTTGRNNWRADGDYRVEIYAVPGAGDDETRFREVARRAYVDTMTAAGNTILSTDDIIVNGRPAFQGLASDDAIAVVKGTNIQFPEHIVITQFLYPAKPGDDLDALPWDCYERLLASIEYLGEE